MEIEVQMILQQEKKRFKPILDKVFVLIYQIQPFV